MKFYPYILTFLICGTLLSGQPYLPKTFQLSDQRSNRTLSINSEYLVFDVGAVTKGKSPVLIYLHGAGGGRPPLNRLGMQANALLKGIERFDKGPCFVVVPQCLPETKKGDRATWEQADLNLLLDDLLEEFPIDAKRVYLTGNSMGGYGCWVWGGHSPERLAAVAPVVGGIGPGGPKDVTPDLKNWAKNLAKVPVYAFAGGKDRVVPAERSESMVAEIRKANGKQAKIKVFPDAGHNARQLVYDSKEFYDWMFAQSKK